MTDKPNSGRTPNPVPPLYALAPTLWSVFIMNAVFTILPVSAYATDVVKATITCPQTIRVKADFQDKAGSDPSFKPKYGDGGISHLKPHESGNDTIAWDGTLLSCTYKVPIAGGFYFPRYVYDPKRHITACTRLNPIQLECTIGEESASTGQSATGDDPTGLKPPLAETGDSCCMMVSNGALKGRMGRLIVTFPDGANAGKTRIDVFAESESKKLLGGYGNLQKNLLPGPYAVSISGRRVNNVIVQAGHDTIVRVGVLRVQADPKTRVDLHEPTNGLKLASGYGNQQIGLPVGPVRVTVAGRTITVTIEAGKITDF